MVKTCGQEGCTKQPTHGVRDSKNKEFCASHCKEGMINIHGKKCSHEGCYKTAAFGKAGTRMKEFCAGHAKDGMVNIASKKCGHDGCTLQPSYGAAGKAPKFCVSHAEAGMVRSGRVCGFAGCTKNPSYGVAGTKRPEFCSGHAQDGMINVVTRRCAHSDCSKHPTFGVAGTKKAEFCSAHAKDKMVVLWCARCSHPGCTKIGSYGVTGSKAKEYCKQHAKEGMVSLNKTCTAAGCPISACYGEKGTKTALFCAKHKNAKAGLVDVNKTECTSPCCTAPARYGVPGSRTKQFCFRHAKVGMVWIGEQRTRVTYPKYRRSPRVILAPAAVPPVGQEALAEDPESLAEKKGNGDGISLLKVSEEDTMQNTAFPQNGVNPQGGVFPRSVMLQQKAGRAQCWHDTRSAPEPREGVHVPLVAPERMVWLQGARPTFLLSGWAPLAAMNWRSHMHGMCGQGGHLPTATNSEIVHMGVVTSPSSLAMTTATMDFFSRPRLGVYGGAYPGSGTAPLVGLPQCASTQSQSFASRRMAAAPTAGFGGGGDSGSCNSAPENARPHVFLPAQQITPASTACDLSSSSGHCWGREGGFSSKRARTVAGCPSGVSSPAQEAAGAGSAAVAGGEADVCLQVHGTEPYSAGPKTGIDVGSPHRDASPARPPPQVKHEVDERGVELSCVKQEEEVEKGPMNSARRGTLRHFS